MTGTLIGLNGRPSSRVVRITRHRRTPQVSAHPPVLMALWGLTRFALLRALISAGSVRDTSSPFSLRCRTSDLFYRVLILPGPLARSTTNLSLLPSGYFHTTTRLFEPVKCTPQLHGVCASDSPCQRGRPRQAVTPHASRFLWIRNMHVLNCLPVARVETVGRFPSSASGIAPTCRLKLISPLFLPFTSSWLLAVTGSLP